MKSLTDMAGNLDMSAAQVLTALRIVATRAGIDEIAEWAAKELEGYHEEDELPAHRTWRLSIKANLVSPIRDIMKDVPLGDFAIEEKHRANATSFHCRDGVWQIEQMLSGEVTEKFGAVIPNLMMLINKGPLLNGGWTCTHATAEFSPIHLTTIVNKARQTALGLCLECEKQGIELRWGEDESTDPEERAKWLNIVKDEGTKVIIRSAWETVWKNIFGGG